MTTTFQKTPGLCDLHIGWVSLFFSSDAPLPWLLTLAGNGHLGGPVARSAAMSLSANPSLLGKPLWEAPGALRMRLGGRGHRALKVSLGKSTPRLKSALGGPGQNGRHFLCLPMWKCAKPLRKILSAHQNPRRGAHEFAYTPVDLEEGYTPPNAGFSPRDTTRDYNLDRQLELESRPDGRTVDNVYKPNGQLERVDHSQGSVTYTYDPTTAQVASVSSPSGETISYVYDGNLVTVETWSGPVIGTIARTYDNHFRLASRTINGGAAITMAHDNDGLLTQAGSLVLARDSANGLVTGTTLGSVTDAYEYNGFGEVTTYNAQFMSVPLYQVSYVRDALGRITQKTETVQGVTHLIAYEYDVAGRLKKVTTDGVFTSEYAFDSNGNRLSYATLTGTVTADYDAQDRMLRYGDYNFTYTRNGELETRVHVPTGDTTTFLYDEFSNLRHVGIPNGDQVDFVVDGRNRRVAKLVNGVLIQAFLYENQLRVATEMDGIGGITSLFVYSGSPNSPDYLVKGGATYRVLKDQLGSPRVVVDSTAGVAAQRMDFDEYGVVTSDTAPAFQSHGFAGGIYDQDTKHVRFGARDYDPQSGRWTSKDPIRFHGASLNLWEYAENDPVNRFDPSGHLAILALPVLLALAQALETTIVGLLVAGAAVAAVDVISSILQEILDQIRALMAARPKVDVCTSDAIPRMEPCYAQKLKDIRKCVSDGLGDQLECEFLAQPAYAACLQKGGG